MPTPLSVSDYFVLDGLKIGNSWAQNRLARLSLEQRQKEQADEIYQKNQDRQQRANESYYDREFRSEEGNLNRQHQERIEIEKSNREDLRQKAYFDRVIAEEEKRLRIEEAKNAYDREQRAAAAEQENIKSLRKEEADLRGKMIQTRAEIEEEKKRERLGVPSVRQEQKYREMQKANPGMFELKKAADGNYYLMGVGDDPILGTRPSQSTSPSKPGVTVVTRDPKTGKFPIPIK